MAYITGSLIRGRISIYKNISSVPRCLHTYIHKFMKRHLEMTTNELRHFILRVNNVPLLLLFMQVNVCIYGVDHHHFIQFYFILPLLDVWWYAWY